LVSVADVRLPGQVERVKYHTGSTDQILGIFKILRALKQPLRVVRPSFTKLTTNIRVATIVLRYSAELSLATSKEWVSRMRLAIDVPDPKEQSR